MSDICSPESATASFTAISAWAASGISAERVTFENPTPLTATLHRFSHIRSFPLIQSALPGAYPHPNPPPPPSRGRRSERLPPPPPSRGRRSERLPPPRW